MLKSVVRAPGFGMVSSIIGLSLISISALAVMYIFADYRLSDAKLKQWTKGEQILNETATMIQEQTFAQVHDFCVAKDALNKTRKDKCVDPGANKLRNIDPATNDPDTGKPKIVEVRRTWTGTPSSSGEACIELTACDEKASGNMLAVTLTGFWKDAKNASEDTVIQVPKKLIFRKLKW